MDMCEEREVRDMDEQNVLCACSAYEQKYYLNQRYDRLPEAVKQELQIMCVMFTEEVGGALVVAFNEEGSLELRCEWDEDDLLYDDIGAGLLVNRLQKEKRDLFEALEMYYRVVILKQPM